MGLIISGDLFQVLEIIFMTQMRSLEIVLEMLLKIIPRQSLTDI